jgi:predicted phosphoribosyltransferase
MGPRFTDRYHAGRRLAATLAPYAGRPNLLVLALPRGGVPVGFEVARALHAPLDVMLVRKLGVPGHEELVELLSKDGQGSADEIARLLGTFPPADGRPLRST